MKVLIITYYWVPSGGSGVQRWLKFVKYFRDFGIEPVVFTVENPNYPIIDESLQKDVPKGIEILRSPIWEPNNILSKVKKSSTKTSAGFLESNPKGVQKILQYIRANYFIPDARKFWIDPSAKKIESYLKNNKVDAIITTGPPHSVHLIGLQLKKRLNVKWIADFRDPWTEIDYFHQLPLTKKSKAKHSALEKEVLKAADITSVVGETMKRSFQKYTQKIKVVTNGYDFEEDKSKGLLDSKFSITHIGLMNSDRNPKTLWKVLKELICENKQFAEDLEIKLIGKIAKEVNEELKSYNFKNITKIDYVPHSEIVKYQKSTQVLLLAVNKVPSAKGIITGKIFEYLQANRPILAIGPEDGDLAEILRKTNSGVVVDFDDEVTLKLKIQEMYTKFKEGNLAVKSINITQYHRKELTQQVSQIIKEIANS